jgi:capsular exopolysaccharide synthesis family protein
MGTEQGSAPTGREDSSSLLDYVEVMRRHKWLVLQAVVIVPLVAVALSLRQSPLYAATASDLFNGQSLAASLSGGADPGSTQDPVRVLQTQASIADAVPVARLALGLAHVRDVTPLEFLDRCSVAAQSDANLLGFTCKDAKPGRAELLAGSYARGFIEYRRRLDTSALEKARENYARRIKDLERRGQTNSQLYASFVDREQQLSTQLALQSSNVSLARAASSATKVQPRPLRNGLLGLGLGAVLAIGLAFLVEALDTRIRSTRELERRLGLPLLARIPEPPRWAARKRHLVMVADPTGDEAEAFRVLRTNLEFFNMEHGARTIMVTSAVEEEGKSTTVANLAVALSRAGRRVVLVDLDLRRPTLDTFFDFQGRPGLTDVVLGRARLAAADAPTADGGSLEVLTTGPLPRDAGEFVAGQALSDVLDELRERADFVLIDSPPLLAVGDAITLAAKVDAIIVLTRLGVARRKAIDELRRVLGNCPGAKLGFVVTGAELDVDHRYGQGYGYGYGGSSYAESAAKGRRR